MYLGRAKDHAADTHRFLNIDTKLVIISRDVIWLNQVYGEYTGSHKVVQWDSIGMIPSKKDLLLDDTPQEDQDPGASGGTTRISRINKEIWTQAARSN